MENDPNKKEFKGKRILKKALRRTSKSSNSSNNESNLGVSRSKSFESKRAAGAETANDSAPLPRPDGATATAADDKITDIALKKTVDIQEQHNIIHEDQTPVSTRDLKLSSQNDINSEPSTSKKNLKRVCPFRSLSYLILTKKRTITS